MVDFAALLDGPIYATVGVPATLALQTGDGSYSITVIDRTKGIELPHGRMEVQTVVPAAKLRMTELTGRGLAIDDLDGSRLTFNGKTWTIRSFIPAPTPQGEAAGELWLILGDETE